MSLASDLSVFPLVIPFDLFISIAGTTHKSKCRFAKTEER